MKLIKLIGICALLLGLSIPTMALTGQSLTDQQSDQGELSKDLQKANERAQEASEVFTQIMDTPDKAIPDYIMERAEVIAIFPDVFKAGFIIGGRKGSGLVSVRDASTRQWSAPVFLKLAGGSFGAQIGASKTDLILVGMNRGAAETFLQEEFNLGGELSAAAGPVGRSLAAETDVPEFDSQFLSYSRSKGLFAGAEIKGVKISQDEDLNEAVYGQQELSVFRTVSQRSPSGVMVFVNTLNRYSRGGAEAVSQDNIEVKETSTEMTDNSTTESSTSADVASDTTVINDNEKSMDANVDSSLDRTVETAEEPSLEPAPTTTPTATTTSEERTRFSKD